MTWYGIERLLYRLSRSSHANSFVLKGALLFTVWGGERHRPTRDLDLLGFGDPGIPRLEAVFQEICSIACDDGLTFDPRSVHGEEIRGVEEYGGVRIKLAGRLGATRIHIQVDVGFGDAIDPPAETIDYPALLDLPARGFASTPVRSSSPRGSTPSSAWESPTHG